MKRAPQVLMPVALLLPAQCQSFSTALSEDWGLAVGWLSVSLRDQPAAQGSFPSNPEGHGSAAPLVFFVGWGVLNYSESTASSTPPGCTRRSTTCTTSSHHPCGAVVHLCSLVGSARPGDAPPSWAPPSISLSPRRHALGLENLSTSGRLSRRTAGVDLTCFALAEKRLALLQGAAWLGLLEGGAWCGRLRALCLASCL